MGALCFFPLAATTTQDQDDSLIFYQKAIEFILSYNPNMGREDNNDCRSIELTLHTNTDHDANSVDVDASLISLILARVSSLTHIIQNHPDYPTIIAPLIACRKRIVTEYGCYDDWSNCVQTAISGVNADAHNVAKNRCTNYHHLLELYCSKPGMK
mmetsp:Transcript_202/g.265  ORF Transcript_202/g.265 Transcript_202/m.265 type:complete len:156 (+) Transcript_202:433-900(+)